MKNNPTIFFLLFLIGCASIDLPPGGQKDIQPPKVLSSSPDSLETFFTGDKIRLSFDEYFVLNNLNQSLIVSPPLKSNPKFIIHGKNLIIEPQETLKPNTTYQFYLADGIKDLNEGNATKNLKLVFSTGPNIDSASLSGTVQDAFTQNPLEDAKVFLYKTQADSQLLFSSPYYITKTDKFGGYSFTHISEGDYFAYVLLDENNNNRLDINERVGFLNEPVKANSDNNIILISREKNPPNLLIQDINEQSKGQYKVAFNTIIQSKKIHVTTNKVLLDISKDKTIPWHFGNQRDTLYLYLNTKENIDTFTITMVIDADSLETKIITKQTKAISPSLSLHTDQNPNTPISLYSNYAIRKTNDQRCTIHDRTDSVKVSIDTFELRVNQVNIDAILTEGHTYRIITEEGFITYSNGLINKKDTFFIETLSSEKTGDIEVELMFDSSQKNQNEFICVLAQKNSTISQTSFNKDTTITFSFLLPGDYFLYVFKDGNKNQIWDDLHYLKKIPSEPIWRNSLPIEVRSKWKTKGISIKIN